MIIEFENYEDYKNYVLDMWEEGYINELEFDGLIVESKNIDGNITYRNLTKEEFENLTKKFGLQNS